MIFAGWILGLCLPAWAAPRVAGVLSVGTELGDLVISSDGRWVATVELGTKQLRVIDTWSWEDGAATPCGTDEEAAGVALIEDEDQLRFFVGCGDGSVGTATLAIGATAQASDVLSSGERISLESGPVLGLAATESAIYLIAENTEEGGNPRVHIVDPDASTADDSSAYPSTIGISGFADVEAGSNYLIVSAGADKVSEVDTSTGSPVLPSSSSGSVEATDIFVTAANTVLLAGGGAGIADYAPGTNIVSIALGGELEDVTAIFTDDDAGELVAADVGAGAFVAVDYSSSSGTVGDDEQWTADFPDDAGDATVVEMVGFEGYVLAATSGGEVWVVTDRPWVEAASPSPSTASTGDQVVVSFTSDEGGAWSLRQGATTDEDGDVLASGTLSADETVSATVTISESYVEGANPLRIVVEGESGAGHDVATVTVDDPPTAVSLSEDNVGFGNEKLTLALTALTAEDIEGYDVYVTTTEFNGSDYPSAGPEFDGNDDLTTPIVVTGEPGEILKVTIAPLTNGQTYYIAVRARDATTEGPMSNVVSGTPQETYSAADLAGEEGGFCGTPLAASGLLAGFGALLGLGRRRRAGGGADARGGLGAVSLLGVAALGLGLALPARADGDDERVRHRATTKLRYGPITFDDAAIQDVFGDSGHEVLWLEGGPAYGDLLEFTLGLGWYQELGFLVGEDGSQSSEHDMLTALPATVNLTARLDFFDEQPLVPFAAVGGDYWLWRENWYVEEGSSDNDRVGGGKYGYHWAVGGELLLDAFDSNRASKLHARTGVLDSYFVVEYRQQVVGEAQEGMVLSADSVTLGLRFDR